MKQICLKHVLNLQPPANANVNWTPTKQFSFATAEPASQASSSFQGLAEQVPAGSSSPESDACV